MAAAAGWMALPFLLLLGFLAGVVYVRLLSGPLSVKFLAQSITRSLAAELPAFDVTVEDVILRLSEEGGIDIQLRNVTLAEQDGTRVAAAPSAAVALSWRALWRGRITPERITFLEPNVRLSYSQSGGLALSFPRPEQAPVLPAFVQGLPRIPSSASPLAVAPGAGTAAKEDGLPSALREIDLARVFAAANARARRGADASAFLKEVGVKGATVVFDWAGRQSTWHVPEAQLSVEHKKKRSIIAGKVSVASPRGPWRLDFRSEDSEKSRTVAVRAAVRNLVPRALMPALPQLPLLATIEAPVNIDADLELSTGGELQSGNFQLALGRGAVHMPWGGMPLAADSAELALRYDRQRHGFEIMPSTFVWGQSRMTVAGTLASSTGDSGEEAWQFEVKSTEGVLAAEEFGVTGVTLESCVAAGRIRPASGIVDVTEFAVRAGGAEVQLAGVLALGSGADGFNLTGRIGTMPIDVLKALWPRSLVPGARVWVGSRVTHGQVKGGTVQIASGALAPHPSGQGVPPGVRPAALAAVAADLQFIAVPGLPPVRAARALVQVVDGKLDVTMPDGAIGQQDRSIALKAGRFTAVELAGDYPQGELSFVAGGPLPAAMDLLNKEPLRALTKGLVLPADGVDGQVEGQLKLTLPLEADLLLRDVKMEGQARITGGKARQVFGPYDVHDGALVFDFDERAIAAQGQVLLGAVPVKINWQHIAGAPADKQPPLRLTARLDNADRTDLGLNVNHIVQGEAAVEMTVSGGAGENAKMRVRADLSNAELVLETLTWRKPIGRPATLQFDMVKGTKHDTELQNFKLVGDDIVIDGWVGIDAQNRLKEVHFPAIALNLVSKLEVRAVVRPDNVWDVKAKGQFFDGRDTFRSFLSLGQTADKAGPPRKDQPDLDIDAEFETVLGFSDVSLRNLRVQMARRSGKLAGLAARGTLDDGSPVEMTLQQVRNEPRKLVTAAEDAGQTFKLIGFYPNLRGGSMRLTVDLDGKGLADKTGVLEVTNFQILGDPVVNEVLRLPDENFGAGRGDKSARRNTTARQVLPFERMRVSFAIGQGQFAFEDAELRGPLLGVTLRGKADLRERMLHLGGTYSPLQDLNAAPGEVPGVGPVLSPRGEGVFGITFAIYGPMDRPQVYINPLSAVAPGIFRDLFPMGPPNSRITPRGDKPKSNGEPPSRVRNAPATAGTAKSAGSRSDTGSSSWSSRTVPSDGR